MAKRTISRGGRSIPRALLLGSGVTLLIAALLLPIMTAMALGAKDPSAMITPYASALTVVLSLLIGFCSAAFYKKRGLLIGMLAGCALSLALFLGALALFGGGSPLGRAVSSLLVISLSTLGGLLGGAKRSRRRRPR